jgi:hypothetical protein
VCNDNDRVYLFETEPQGEEHRELLTTVRKGASMFYSDVTGALYFLDETGMLRKAQLVPQEGLVDQILNKGQ